MKQCSSPFVAWVAVLAVVFVSLAGCGEPRTHEQWWVFSEGVVDGNAVVLAEDPDDLWNYTIWMFGGTWDISLGSLCFDEDYEVELAVVVSPTPEDRVFDVSWDDTALETLNHYGADTDSCSEQERAFLTALARVDKLRFEPSYYRGDHMTLIGSGVELQFFAFPYTW